MCVALRTQCDMHAPGLLGVTLRAPATTSNREMIQRGLVDRQLRRCLGLRRYFYRLPLPALRV
jgi:hypothetical protein